MLTDRDIVMRAVADNCSPDVTPVREVMSKKICYCFEDNDLDDAAVSMSEHQVRRLPVLNRKKRLVGMVTLADLSRCQPDIAKVALEGISRQTGETRHMTH
jgi:CBS domain-containing protein